MEYHTQKEWCDSISEKHKQHEGVYTVYMYCSCTSIMTPQMLKTKQHNDPIGPHKQKTIFPAIPPDEGIASRHQVFNEKYIYLQSNLFLHKDIHITFTKNGESEKTKEEALYRENRNYTDKYIWYYHKIIIKVT